MNGDWLNLATDVIPSILTAISLIGTVFFEYTGHPDDRYQDKVKELRKHRWGEVAGALGEVIVEVRDKAKDSDDDDINDQPTDEAMYALVLQRKYNSELIKDVEMELDEYEEPLRYYRLCRKSMDRLTDRLLIALVVGIISIGFALLGSLYALLAVGVGSGVSLTAIASAGRHFYTYRSARSELDEMWEQYNFVKDI